MILPVCKFLELLHYFFIYVHWFILGGITKALITHGMNVVGCGRNFEKLKEFAADLSGPGTFVPVQCDVSKEDQVIDINLLLTA